MCSAPVLTHFDFSLPIVVYCDPSPYGVGVVLTHIFCDNSEKPVCYTSCTLSPAGKNYAHIEKNRLAVIFAIRKLHQYLYGHVFKIITDHNLLLGLFGQNKATPPMVATRIQCWGPFLSTYNYTLEYLPGSSNANADCLSQLLIPADEFDYSKNVNEIQMLHLDVSPITSTDFEQHTSKDPVLSKILLNIQKD